MTVIRPNSVSGITSITAQANEINFFRSNGTLAGLQLNGVNFNTTAGISTLAALKVTGNLDVEGVLTYQDVTNVDSVGIITARSGIRVGANGIKRETVHLDAGDSGANYLRFTNTGTGNGVADGFNVGINADEDALIWNFENKSTIFATNNTERLRIASNGAVSINYAGTGDNTLHIGNTSDAGGIIIKSPGNHYANIVIDSNRSGANNGIFNLAGKWNGNDVAYISFTTGTDTTNKDDGYIRMYTRESGQSLTENVRITSSGVLKLTGQTTSIETAGFTHHTNNNLYIRGGTTGAVLQSVDGNESWVVQNDYISGSTSGSERLRITSGGKLLVGATSGSNHFISSGSDTLNTVFQANLGGAGATCAIRVKMNTSANDGLQIQQNGSGTAISGGAHCTSIFNRENAPLRLGTNNSERLRISANGYVTTPNQPSFRAGLNSNTTFASSSDIVFNDVSATWHHNIGNHYNTSNGRFTAPVTGVYHFDACIIFGPSITNNLFMGDAFLFYINGGYACYSGRRGYYVSGTTGNQYYTDHISCRFKMNATDYITVRNGSPWTGVHGNTYYTWFAGTLLG